MGPFGKTHALNEARVWGVLDVLNKPSIQGEPCILEVRPAFWSLMPRSVCKMSSPSPYAKQPMDSITIAWLCAGLLFLFILRVMFGGDKTISD